MKSTVQVRVDEETRKKAAELFECMGLDIPTAIRMFLRQSIESNGLPFQPTLLPKNADGFSPYDAARIERARRQLDAGGGSFHELGADLGAPPQTPQGASSLGGEAPLTPS